MQLDPDFRSDLVSQVMADLHGTCIFPHEPREHIYHYTTLEGLSGILGGKLWQTDVSYMNDASEYSYSQELVKKPPPRPTATGFRGS